VSELSFGAWAIGGSWGQVDDSESLAALERAVELGCNLIDTADCYGNGRSEKIIAEFKNKHPEKQIYVATKAGRLLDPHVASGYTGENIARFIERSREYLQQQTLDLVQLHCPPVEVYYNPKLFKELDGLVAAGKMGHYGVSVEKVEEALKAIDYPNVATVQIVFNMFRHRPTEVLFPLAKQRDVGILARVPLASGLLTGKLTPQTQFAQEDHRHFNRNGEAFDKGETFSGVDYELGLKAVSELNSLKPADVTLTKYALRWILDHEEVTCAIPGARRPAQAEDNFTASALASLSKQEHSQVKSIYDKYIKDPVHYLW